MNPARRVSLRCLCAAGLAAIVAACASTGDDAAPTLSRSAQAMGSSGLKTLRYAASGTGYTFGQAYTPGGAWPKITVHSMTRTIDYDSGAMRDEIVLSRAEPLGGGGYPLSGQQRNDQFVSGEIAWNQTGGDGRAGPALRHRPDAPALDHAARRAQGGAAQSRDVAAHQRRRQRRLVQPAGPLQRDRARRRRRPRHAGRLGLRRPGAGRHRAVTTYSDYRDFGGVKFPTRVRQTIGGYPVLDLAVKEVQVNPSLALPVPDAARNTAERVTSEKVADGVWFVAGGSHNSVAIEMQDHLVLVETPLNDARTQAVIEQVKALAPGKPIRYVVNSHQPLRPLRRRARGRRRRRDDRHRTPTTWRISSARSRRRTGSGPTRWRAPERRRASGRSATSWRWPTRCARSSSTASPAARTARAS